MTNKEKIDSMFAGNPTLILQRLRLSHTPHHFSLYMIDAWVMMTGFILGLKHPNHPDGLVKELETIKGKLYAGFSKINTEIPHILARQEEGILNDRDNRVMATFLSHNYPVPILIESYDLFLIVSVLQQATRHPDMADSTRNHIDSIAKGLTDDLKRTVTPSVIDLLLLGFDTAFDVDENFNLKGKQ